MRRTAAFAVLSGRATAPDSNLPGQPIDGVRREVILGRQVPDRCLTAYRHLYRAQGPARFECAPLPPHRGGSASRSRPARLNLGGWILR